MDTNTQLFDTINKQNWPTLRKLIEDNKEVDLNIRDNSNNYLVQFIILYNQIDLIDLFLQRKCKFDIIDYDGKTLLYYAIKLNYYDIVKKLLSISYVGMPLIELGDKNKFLPIHYAILFNNFKVLELLIEKKANINAKDGNGNTPLITSIKTKNIDITKFLLKQSTINLNITNSVGETALHIACNYELDTIVDLLLENPKIDINIQEKQNKYTPLMYSVSLNNYNITNSLLSNKNINLLIQDSTGSTAFHHGLIENSSEEIIKLLDDSMLEYMYNISNIYGYTILHLLLENNIQIDLKKYIKYTNLNIQTNAGNTIWHLFGKRWLNYIAELENKKNNVFIKNKKAQTAYDMYKENEKFIDLLVKSYYNYLKSKKEEWKEDWENICYSNPLVKKIDFKDTTNEKTCYDRIKKHIITDNISVPSKKSNYCVAFDNNPITEFVSYTGTSLDILSGMLFLKQQYENVFTSLTKKFILNDDLNEYFKIMGIIRETKGEYINFEITWLYQKIFFPSNIDSIINTFVESKKRFLVIPVGIHQANGAHANILLYDSETNEMERFEPSGGDHPIEYNYNPELLDFHLQNFFNEKFKNLKYFQPNKYEMNIGFQTMEIVDINKKIGDPNGFCGAWCIWWVDMRIKNTKISREKLFVELVKTIRRNNLSFKTIIRSFSKQITDLRDSLLKKVSLDINKWLNDDFDYDTLDRFNSIIEKLI